MAKNSSLFNISGTISLRTSGVTSALTRIMSGAKGAAEQIETLAEKTRLANPEIERLTGLMDRFGDRQLRKPINNIRSMTKAIGGLAAAYRELGKANAALGKLNVPTKRDVTRALKGISTAQAIEPPVPSATPVRRQSAKSSKSAPRAFRIEKDYSDLYKKGNRKTTSGLLKKIKEAEASSLRARAISAKESAAIDKKIAKDIKAAKPFDYEAATPKPIPKKETLKRPKKTLHSDTKGLLQKLEPDNYRNGEKIDSSGLTRSERKAWIAEKRAAKDAERKAKDKQVRKVRRRKDAVKLEQQEAVDAVRARKDAVSAAQQAKVAKVRAEKDAVTAEQLAKVAKVRAEKDAITAEQMAKVDKIRSEKDAVTAKQMAMVDKASERIRREKFKQRQKEIESQKTAAKQVEKTTQSKKSADLAAAEARIASGKKGAGINSSRISDLKKRAKADAARMAKESAQYTEIAKENARYLKARQQETDDFIKRGMERKRAEAEEAKQRKERLEQRRKSNLERSAQNKTEKLRERRSRLRADREIRKQRADKEFKQDLKDSKADRKQRVKSVREAAKVQAAEALAQEKEAALRRQRSSWKGPMADRLLTATMQASQGAGLPAGAALGLSPPKPQVLSGFGKAMKVISSGFAAAKVKADAFNRGAERAWTSLNRIVRASSFVKGALLSIKTAFRDAVHVFMGMTFHTIFMGFISGIRNAVSATVEFQHALRELNGLAKASESHLKELAEGFRTAPTRLGIGVDQIELIKGTRSLMAAGYTDVDQAAAIAEQGALMAKAGGMEDFQKGIELLGTTMKAWGADSSQAERFTNILINATDQGLVNLEQMYQSLGRLSPIAAQAGISIDEVGAFVGTATASGLRAESAITGLAQGITKLINPTKQGREELEKLGLTINEARIRTEGLAPVFKELYTASAGQGSVVESLKKVLGTQRAVAAFLATASQGDFTQLESNIAMASLPGVKEQRIAELQKTAKEQWKLITAEVTGALEWLGEELDGIVAKAIAAVRELKPQLNNLFNALRYIITDIIETLTADQGLNLATAIIFVTDAMLDLYNVTKVLANLFSVAIEVIQEGLSKFTFSGAAKGALAAFNPGAALGKFAVKELPKGLREHGPNSPEFLRKVEKGQLQNKKNKTPEDFARLKQLTDAEIDIEQRTVDAKSKLLKSLERLFGDAIDMQQNAARRKNLSDRYSTTAFTGVLTGEEQVRAKKAEIRRQANLARAKEDPEFREKLIERHRKGELARKGHQQRLSAKYQEKLSTEEGRKEIAADPDKWKPYFEAFKSLVINKMEQSAEKEDEIDAALEEIKARLKADEISPKQALAQLQELMKDATKYEVSKGTTRSVKETMLKVRKAEDKQKSSAIDDSFAEIVHTFKMGPSSQAVEAFESKSTPESGSANPIKQVADGSYRYDSKEHEGGSFYKEQIAQLQKLLRLAKDQGAEAAKLHKIEEAIKKVKDEEVKVTQTLVAKEKEKTRLKDLDKQARVAKVRAQVYDSQDNDLQAKLALLDADVAEFKKHEQNKTLIAQFENSKRLAILKDHFDRVKQATLQAKADTVANEVEVHEKKAEMATNETDRKAEQGKADKLRRQQELDETVRGIEERVKHMKKESVDEVTIMKYVKSEQQKLLQQVTAAEKKGVKETVVDEEYSADPRLKDGSKTGFAVSTFRLGGEYAKIDREAEERRRKLDPAATKAAAERIEGLWKTDPKEAARQQEELDKVTKAQQESIDAEKDKNKVEVVNTLIVKEVDANGRTILKSSRSNAGERNDGDGEFKAGRL